MKESTSTDQELRDAIDMVSQAFSDARYGEALLMLRPLADAGVAEAIGMLALAYERGAGVEMDSEKAIELYKKAMEMGDAIAAFHLSKLYRRGMASVEANFDLAEQYLKRAKDLGLEDSAF